MVGPVGCGTVGDGNMTGHSVVYTGFNVSPKRITKRPNDLTRPGLAYKDVAFGSTHKDGVGRGRDAQGEFSQRSWGLGLGSGREWKEGTKTRHSSTEQGVLEIQVK